MTDIPIRKVFAVEVSGACNLEATCSWCPMHQRPRSRKRGLMSDATVTRALHWVERLEKCDALALHNFGEPLLHPKFDEIALAFSRLTPITVSTNAVLLDERWADRLSRIPWAWISISPWSPEHLVKAVALLKARGIDYMLPPGVTHNFAGQAIGPTKKLFKGCANLNEGKAVIRWDGSLASCCISDREEDSLGNVAQEPNDVRMRSYSLCATCHHAL